jgi:putative ATP-dependent endonuclease of OLD family
MRIVNVSIQNFRAVKKLTFSPKKENVFIGPNNIGKTAIVEAINLALNPEFSSRQSAIDENDFYKRQYKIKKPSIPHPPGVTENSEPEFEYPNILIDLVLAPVTDAEDEAAFVKHFVAWDENTKTVHTEFEDGVDPFSDGRQKAIWITFQAMYDPTEDEFVWNTYFKTKKDDVWILSHDGEMNVPRVSREAKRRIGFLIYRDIRALQRPVNLEPQGLLSRIAQSQEALPKNFESSFHKTLNALHDLSHESKFGLLINELAIELETYLPLSSAEKTNLKFELTDRTRDQFKVNAQMYIDDAELSLPAQKFGAGTRSILSLGMLTFIMRKRGRGILALEEPETFLYPHAQRRVIAEAKKLASQVFVTTHSPFILEQFPVESLARIQRKSKGELEVSYLSDEMDSKFYKRHLRKQIAEALLSRAVVITEEDSIAKWLRECSSLMEHQPISEKTNFESFDLAGISVISADGNGNALPLANFLESAGLPVIICLDETKKGTNFDSWVQSGKPHFILKHKGLESLFVNEFDDAFIETICTDAEGTDGHRVKKDDLTPENRKKMFMDFLIRHKGSIPFQEWMISKVTTDKVPSSFKSAIEQSLNLISPGGTATPPLEGKSDV